MENGTKWLVRKRVAWCLVLAWTLQTIYDVSWKESVGISSSITRDKSGSNIRITPGDAVGGDRFDSPVIQRTPTSFWTEEQTTSATGESIVAAWHWHDRARLHKYLLSNHNNNNHNQTDVMASPTIRIPNSPPFVRYSLQSALERRNLRSAPTHENHSPSSVVLYGSSHLREVYFSLIRLERGLKFDAPLEDAVTRLPSGLRKDQRAASCDPDDSGWIHGHYGVDLDACGVPGKRLVPELTTNETNGVDDRANTSVAIGFKTFLHTPDADDLFLEFLQTQHLRHPSFLVVDLGIWGARGPKLGGKNSSGRTSSVLTPGEEVDYYFDWLQRSFPNSTLVYIYEPTNLRHLILPRLVRDSLVEQRHSVVLRKDLIQSLRPAGMPCGHGCGGPVTMALAMLLMDFMAESSNLSVHAPCA